MQPAASLAPCRPKGPICAAIFCITYPLPWYADGHMRCAWSDRTPKTQIVPLCCGITVLLSTLQVRPHARDRVRRPDAAKIWRVLQVPQRRQKISCTDAESHHQLRCISNRCKPVRGSGATLGVSAVFHHGTDGSFHACRSTDLFFFFLMSHLPAEFACASRVPSTNRPEMQHQSS